jgi:integrase
MTVNGFRRIASTMLNEMGWNRHWIEVQLAHVEGNKVGRAYNAAEYLEDRTRMMQAWADHLDGLAAGEGLAAAVGDYAAVCPYKQSR